MYRTLSGREAADNLLMKAKRKVQQMEKKPTLGIVLVGNDPASQVYVNMKIKKAASAGVQTQVHRLPDNMDETELLQLVARLNDDDGIDGFIVQAPLPKQIDGQKVIEAISPEKDVDGWTSTNMGRLFLNMDTDKIFLPATPAGVVRMLEFHDVPIEGKNAVIVGRSNVVGKPLAILLLRKNATVTICHSKTQDLAKHTKEADILVAAVGVPGMIGDDMVKRGAFVIDVGTTKVGAGVVGDVQFDKVIKKAHCSPVPGGAGPMTVAMLINNVVLAAERRS